MSAGVAGASRALVPSAALDRILEIARAIPDLAGTVGFERSHRVVRERSELWIPNGGRRPAEREARAHGE